MDAMTTASDVFSTMNSLTTGVDGHTLSGVRNRTTQNYANIQRKGRYLTQHHLILNAMCTGINLEKLQMRFAEITERTIATMDARTHADHGKTFRIEGFRSWGARHGGYTWFIEYEPGLL